MQICEEAVEQPPNHPRRCGKKAAEPLSRADSTDARITADGIDGVCVRASVYAQPDHGYVA